MREDNRILAENLSEAELKEVYTDIKSTNFTFGNHAFDKMKVRGVTQNQIKAMLNYFKVIEIHNNIPSEIRVLVRGKVQGVFVCAVLSLTTKSIVTLYKNGLNNHHQNLDKSNYKGTFNYSALKRNLVNR